MRHLICLLLLCFALDARAQNQETLKLATFEFPPLLHTAKNGQFSGTVGETVKMLCRKAGLHCEVELLPFKRAYQKLETKEIDGLITIRAAQFEACCQPSQWSTPWAAGLFSKEAVNNIPQTAEDVKKHSLIVVNGMRSPYLFMPDLDQWTKNSELELFLAPTIFQATKMFKEDRATLLWGSEDFHWYFEKMGVSNQVNFLPLIVRPIVVWVTNEKQSHLDKLNEAYNILKSQEVFTSTNLLVPDLMQQNFVDAPF